MIQRLDEESSRILAEICADKRDKIFLCIGDPSHIWDSYAPMVGSLLEMHGVNVFGSVKYPVNFHNVEEVEDRIKNLYPESIIIAIDSCTTNSKNKLGKIFLNDTGIKPGSAFSQELRTVGDYSILFGVDFSDINNRLIKNPFLAALDTYEVLKTAFDIK